VAAEGPLVTFELTFADVGISYSDSAAWGYWDRAKYDALTPVTESDSGPLAARLTSQGQKYVLLLAGERYPDLGVLGTRTDPETGGQVLEELGAEIEAYDIGYGRRYVSSSGFRAMPWGAITHVRIEEARIDVTDGMPPSDEDREEASSHLWGLAAGSDFGMRVTRGVTVTGRVVIRWAQGDREAWVTSTTPDEGNGEGSVKLTDDTSRTMYGVELGVRWTPVGWLAMEGGWWYRDWSVDDGPATYDGPFLRVAFGF
jgi:hypothetical protein